MILALKVLLVTVLNQNIIKKYPFFYNGVEALPLWFRVSSTLTVELENFSEKCESQKLDVGIGSIIIIYFV